MQQLSVEFGIIYNTFSSKLMKTKQMFKFLVFCFDGPFSFDYFFFGHDFMWISESLVMTLCTVYVFV